MSCLLRKQQQCTKHTTVYQQTSNMLCVDALLRRTLQCSHKTYFTRLFYSHSSYIQLSNLTATGASPQTPCTGRVHGAYKFPAESGLLHLSLVAFSTSIQGHSYSIQGHPSTCSCHVSFSYEFTDIDLKSVRGIFSINNFFIVPLPAIAALCEYNIIQMLLAHDCAQANLESTGFQPCPVNRHQRHLAAGRRSRHSSERRPMYDSNNKQFFTFAIFKSNRNDHVFQSAVQCPDIVYQRLNLSCLHNRPNHRVIADKEKLNLTVGVIPVINFRLFSSFFVSETLRMSLACGVNQDS